MNSSMRKWSALGAAAVLAAGVTGCSAGGGDEPVVLTWWATQQSASIGDSEAAYLASIARFTERTGIEVEVEVVPWADLYNKILTAVSSGTGPDVLSIGTTWTASLHDTGALAVVEGEDLETIGGEDRYVPSTWEASLVPGEERTVIPLLSNVYSLYYNPVLFAEAGIDGPPATWDEFVETGKKLTKDTDGDGRIDQWGFTAAAAAATGNAHFAFILGEQEGGSFVDADGAATLSSPAQAEGITKFIDLMAVHQIMPTDNAEIDLGADSVDQFIGGSAAMIMQQNPVEQFESRGFEDWEVAQMPVVAGGDNVQSMVAGTNITVFDDSAHKKEAFEFIGHLTEPAEQAQFAAAFRMLPVAADAFEEEVFASLDDRTLDTRREILDSATAPFPLVGNIGEIESTVGNAMREMFQAYATGNPVDIERRLVEADAQLN